MNAGEMLFIFLLALILFGPKKLPEIGREIGKFLAEFRRASNDFTYQLQAEIEKAGVETGPVTPPGAQQSSSFTQTLLPFAGKSEISEIDGTHERLMGTARMAFDTRNFTLLPPDAAPASPESDSKPESVELKVETSAPPVQASAAAAASETLPVEAVSNQPTPDSAAARSDSAPQNS